MVYLFVVKAIFILHSKGGSNLFAVQNQAKNFLSLFLVFILLDHWTSPTLHGATILWLNAFFDHLPIPPWCQPKMTMLSLPIAIPSQE